MARLAPALDYAHNKNVVHRDLKPGNILFDSNNEPYISDFGIARLTSGGASMTGSGIVGTPGYMSPEQAKGEKVIDGRSDIYALGIIVFEMLTGKLPYEADTPMGVIVKHITEPVPRILDVKPDLPRGCEMIIEQAMAKDRDKRFATANDLAETLAGVAKGEQVTMQALARRTARAKRSQVRPAPEPKRTSPWVWVVGGLVALGLVAGLALGGGAIFSALAGATAVATLSPVDLASTQSSQMTATADFVITATGQAEETATADAEAALAAIEAGTATAEAEAAVAMAAATQFSLEATATAEAESNAASAATAAAQAGATAGVEATASALLSAPKIAFFKNSDLWVVNLDGTNLTQLTNDGGQKGDLRWLPDGRTVTYTTGLCVKAIDFMTLEERSLGCFNSSETLGGFEVSPDSKYFAVSVDGSLFVGDYDPEELARVNSRGDLVELANCLTYTRNETRSVRWSRDSSRLAVEVVIPFNNISAEVIRLFDLECGQTNLSHLDEFPGTRFSYPSYLRSPQLQNYGWDGGDLFAFVDSIRNDGFGDIYVYNNGNKRAPRKILPISTGACCYRDPQWSANGDTLAFVFQNIEGGSDSKTELYYIPYGQVGTGSGYKKIPLPDGFFTNPREKPQPVMAP
jgi:Tol biopolymer transport system component